MADKVKLSAPQFNAMVGARDHGDPGHGLSGRSAFGGLTWTCAALRRHGLFDRQNKLTDAGEMALSEHEGEGHTGDRRDD